MLKINWKLHRHIHTLIFASYELIMKYKNELLNKRYGSTSTHLNAAVNE